MKKNNIKLYVTLNIIYNILEPIIISSIVYLITKDLNTSINICFFLYIIGIIFGILFSFSFTKAFRSEGENIEAQKMFDEIFGSVYNITKRKYNLFFMDYLPNPAFVVKNNMVINPTLLNHTFIKKTLRGIIAHEAGHAISGFNKYVFVSLYRSSTIILLILKLCYVLYATNIKWIKVISIIIYYIFLPLNIINIIINISFQRKDEYIANSNALNYCMDELRYYYYYNYINSDKVLENMQVSHPKVKKMLDKMNEELKLNDFEKHIYVIDNEIVAIDTKELNMTYNDAKFKYLRKHKNENDKFMFDYAMCLYKGKGCKSNLNEALKYFSKLDYNYLEKRSYLLDTNLKDKLNLN